MPIGRRPWQEELAIIDHTMKAISDVTDPETFVNIYYNNIGALIPANDYVSVSRRNVAPPFYLITRSSRFKEHFNPWTQRDLIPRLSGGLLGEIAYANEPVIIDDVPASDIGGVVDLGVLALSGTDHIEVLRGPNSALHGADALAGVVSISTPRGTTPLPQVTYSADGGNFRTYRQEGTLAGSHKQFDYFSDFSRFDTARGVVNRSGRSPTASAASNSANERTCSYV